MNELNLDIISFDLKQFSNREEYQKIIDTNNLSIDSKKLFALRSKFDKIWIDKNTNIAIAVSKIDGDIVLTQDAMTLFKKVKSISVDDDFDLGDFTGLNMDDILDKINDKGMESLTAKELEFLKKDSKN